MNPRPFWQERHFWLGAGLVLLPKLAWLLWYGVLYEFDSIGYLRLQADLLHPPGYNAFCAALMWLTGRPESITLAQTVLFSLALSHAAHHWVGRIPLRLGLLLVLGLEPCTALLCADLMSEVFFLSLLLPFLVLCGQLMRDHAKLPWGKILLAGLLLGLLLLVRHAALIVGMGVAAAFVLSALPWRQRVLVPAVLLVLAQALQLPLKLYYHQQFGTWQTSAYAGYSLWGSAAHLVPGSHVSASPLTDFERHIATLPAETFTPEKSLNTSQLFSPALPLQSYLREHPMSTAGQMDFSEELKGTATSLILAQPMRHLRDFVLPNLSRPLHNREVVDTRSLDSEIPAEWKLQRHRETVYTPAAWWPWMLLLLAAVLFSLARLRSVRREPALWLLAAVVGANWLASHLVGAVFLRYVYFLVPLLALWAAGLLDKLILKGSGKS